MANSVFNEQKVIVFQLQDKEYGVFVQNVKSIEKVDHITRVPKTADYIKGVINLRGVVTPIIDLRKRLNMPEKEITDQTRVIIAVQNEMEVGLIVDSANDVVDISEDSIEPAPSVIEQVETEFIKGITKLDKRLIMLLDLEKVLSKENQRVIEHEQVV
ncbi:MAG: chemotaxis protein CheW [Bacillaceae bacterium]|jgi:Chemotaxis signal transduction protein|uniref:Chemotaxis protein CheW n=2 Tax=Aeribacillus TaxID=1055323 RepID=A0A164BYN2_9BACI|nr:MULTISPECIES: chemotaxis protein CheW [Aeribacillus]AXI39820.1 chemotaxis protein CheW [Bacillaceae bacterium ZC4]REJ19523.1 MAG: chemotaxis protein CheW [Bacillaceae bacterium]KZM57956.1 chemotaxis protein CheW [Aeribacillus pallidus]KZN97619.1 chemotaxis protein CheW [Aeribacillus pallidus]MDR9791908.1 chemotaxis protein CheW [Aeribacillus pallidus]